MLNVAEWTMGTNVTFLESRQNQLSERDVSNQGMFLFATIQYSGAPPKIFAVKTSILVTASMAHCCRHRILDRKIQVRPQSCQSYNAMELLDYSLNLSIRIR